MAKSILDLAPTELLVDGDEEWIQEFLDTLQSPDWTVSSEDPDGFKICYMKNAKSDVLVVKGAVPINVPMAVAYHFITDEENFEHYMKTVDPMCKFAKYVQKTDVKHTVKTAEFNLTKPLWPRDFVWKELNTVVPSGGSLSIGKSVEHKDCPPAKSSWLGGGAVRGEIAGSGYYFTSTGENQCTVEYLVQVDPKGGVPTSAVNLMCTDQAKNVKRLKEYLEAKHPSS
jgi:hypothetical protein